MTQIIGLLGGAGSGKSTVADYLVSKYGAKRYALAAPLKQIAINTMGFSEEQIYGTQAQKEAIDERYGISPRVFLQRLGTEGLRAVFGEDVWVKLLLKKIYAEKPEIAVVDDVRFENEARILREDGAVIWRLENPSRSTSADATHASEAGWTNAEYDTRIAPERAGLDVLYPLIDKAFFNAMPRRYETPSSIATWANETFGPSTSLRTACRAQEELDELISELADNGLTAKAIEEVADIFIVLYRLPVEAQVNIAEAIDRKMAINRARTWKLDGSGCGYHVNGAVTP